MSSVGPRVENLLDLDALFGPVAAAPVLSVPKPEKSVTIPPVLDIPDDAADRVEEEEEGDEEGRLKEKSSSKKVGTLRSRGSADIIGSTPKPVTNVLSPGANGTPKLGVTASPHEGPIPDWEDLQEENRCFERSKRVGLMNKLFSNKPMHGYETVNKSLTLTETHDMVMTEEKEPMFKAPDSMFEEPKSKTSLFSAPATSPPASADKGKESAKDASRTFAYKDSSSTSKSWARSGKARSQSWLPSMPTLPSLSGSRDKSAKGVVRRSSAAPAPSTPAKGFFSMFSK